MSIRSTIAATLASTLMTSSASAACLVQGPGFSWDLSSIGNKSYTWRDETGDFDYTATLCGTKQCGDNPASLCQAAVNYPPVTGLMTWEADNVWTRTKELGVTSTFKNGALCNGKNRATTVTLLCEDGEAGLLGVNETTACNYEAVIRIPKALCSAGPVPTACRFIKGYSDCNANATTDGLCHWCSSTLVAQACYSETQARNLDHSKFTCDWLDCTDLGEEGLCRQSLNGGYGNSHCAWCDRIALKGNNTKQTAQADPGCISTITADQLPPDIWSCRVGPSGL